MQHPLGVAVLGCGYWGTNYVRVLNELPGSRVVAVCDQEPERLQEMSRRFPGVCLVTDVEELLRLDEVEAVVICTPAVNHSQVARRCLAAGRHALIEKPITTVTSEAEELIQMAETHGLTLMAGHTFMYNPAVRSMKRYVDNGDLGRIYYLYARHTNLGPIRRDVNALWDLAPHDISIFNYLLDSSPEWVSATAAPVLRNPRADVGFIALGYPNGVMGHIHVSWVDPHKVREVVIVGSDKRVVFNDLNAPEQVRIYHKGVSSVGDATSTYGEYQLAMRDGDILSPRIEVGEPLKLQCNHFIDCVRQSSHPLTSGKDGLEVVRVMEAIDRSIANRGTPVMIQLERYV